MNPFTRRSFLTKTAQAAAGAGLLRLFSSWSVQAAAHPLAAAARGRDSDTPEELLRAALDGIGGISRFVKPGQVVAIKPNATWSYPPHTASSTDPEVLEAMVKLVREAGASRIIVMDHCSIDPGAAEALRMSGIGSLVDRLGVEKVFPDRSASPKSMYTQIEVVNGKAFPKLGVIKAAVEADVRINLAVAKCHVVTRITMTLKHMMGFLHTPGEMHAQLDQGIVDLHSPSPISTELHILEAIRVRHPVNGYRRAGGFETDQTHPNIVRRMNQIVAGTDPVLIDSYGCLNYFNMEPYELSHLLRAARAGIGEMDVRQAINDGRMRLINVGATVLNITPQPTSTATPVPEPSLPAADTTPIPPGRVPTATPLPTAQPISVQPPGISLAATPCPTTDSATGFLQGTILPAAVVVIGAGTAILKRLAAGPEKREKVVQSSPEEKE